MIAAPGAPLLAAEACREEVKNPRHGPGTIRRHPIPAHFKRMAHRVTCQASTTATLPAELVTLIDLPCTPQVPDIHLPWTYAAPGRVPATMPTHPIPHERGGQRAPRPVHRQPGNRWASGEAIWKTRLHGVRMIVTPHTSRSRRHSRDPGALVRAGCHEPVARFDPSGTTGPPGARTARHARRGRRHRPEPSSFGYKKTVVVPGASHLVHLDRPDGFTAAIRAAAAQSP